MTTDEIVKRRGLSWDNIALRILIHETDFESHKEYAFCSQYRIDTWAHTDSQKFDIIGYYPSAELWLIKRKAPQTKSTIIVEYRLYGDQVRVSNFRLDSNK